METLSVAIQPVSANLHAPNHRRSLGRASQVGTGQPATEGFISCQFKPLCRITGVLPPQKRTERDFYKSLALLGEHHGFTPEEHRNLSFPYNLMLAMHDAQQRIDPWEDREIVWQSTQSGKCLALKEATAIPHLLLLPVVPLYKLLKSDNGHSVGLMLLSLFSYLYQKAGIAYFLNDWSPINDLYQLVENEPEDFAEGEELVELNAEIREAMQVGQTMLRVMRNKVNIDAFEQRVWAFKPNNYFGLVAKDIAKAGLQLYKDFPNRNFNDHLEMYHASGNSDEDYRYPFSPEHYLSFCAHGTGRMLHEIKYWANETAADSVVIGPLYLTVYDSPVSHSNDPLVFENKLIAIIDRLINLLKRKL